MQTYFRIILPLVRPILAVSGLLVFVATIAEFLLASIFLTAGSKKTLAVGLYGLIDADRSNNLGVFAAALLTAVPVVLLFMFLQRYIVGGITAGGVKGVSPSHLFDPHHDGSPRYVLDQALSSAAPSPCACGSLTTLVRARAPRTASGCGRCATASRSSSPPPRPPSRGRRGPAVPGHLVDDRAAGQQPGHVVPLPPCGTATATGGSTAPACTTAT